MSPALLFSIDMVSSTLLLFLLYRVYIILTYFLFMVHIFGHIFIYKLRNGTYLLDTLGQICEPVSNFILLESFLSLFEGRLKLI